jgi:peptide/nickel transport system substrate-binding protein
MKNAIKFLMIGVIVALTVAALPSTPAAVAQDSGGTVIEGTFGSGPSVLTPLTCSDTTCRRIEAFLFPGLLGTNPKTQSIEKGVPGSLAKDWTISEDGKTITYKLVTDRKWSDGTPITSKDFAFLWKLANDPDSGYQLVFATEFIDKVETPDDYTIVVTMKDASCTILANSSLGNWLPSHVFGDTKIPELKNLPWDKNPTVTAGPFKLKEYRNGELTALVSDPNFVSTSTSKPVQLEGYIQKVVPDQTVEVEQFLAGEIGLVDTPPVNRRADIRAAEDKGDAKAFSFPGNSWDYVAFNLADPTNPQNALDKDGKPIDQGKHPLFGDLQVRKAIAMAIDVDAIIKGAVFGEGTRMSSFLIPTSWGHDKPACRGASPTGTRKAGCSTAT